MSLKGIDVILRKARDIKAAMEQDAFMGAAQDWVDNDVVPAAKAIAPVDSGEFRDGIGGEVNPNQIRIYASAPHSSFVEDGTSKMPARPTLRPTIQKMRPKLLARVRAKLREML
ncbi:HK97-gp10 family putative phage morphogenesis protein [Sphingobium chungangianum]